MLKAQLEKSIAKKREVEDVITNEVETLREKILEVKSLELSRVEQLEILLESLNAASVSKDVEVNENSNILSELVDLRKRVSEDAIASQLDSAISQKAKLVDLEKETLEDIKILAFDVENDFQKARESINTFENVLKSFPSAENNDGYFIFCH